MSAYQKRWELARLRGQLWTPRPADRAREHIQRLHEAGATYRAIARACGLDPRAVRNIANGVSQSIHIDNERRVLAVDTATMMRVSKMVESTGTIRRIHALRAIGWTDTEMQRRSGIGIRSVSQQRSPWVTAHTAEAVRKLYDELSMTPGPSRRARERARIKGYAPPLAYDDSSIDDRDAQPNVGELVPIKDPRQSEHTAAEARFLLSCGVSLDQAARQLGVTPKYLTDTLPGRLGRREAS